MADLCVRWVSLCGFVTLGSTAPHQVYESVRDFARVAMDYPFSGRTAEDKPAYTPKLLANLDKYLPNFEALIAANPDSDVFTVSWH